MPQFNCTLSIDDLVLNLLLNFSTKQLFTNFRLWVISSIALMMSWGRNFDVVSDCLLWSNSVACQTILSHSAIFSSSLAPIIYCENSKFKRKWIVIKTWKYNMNIFIFILVAHSGFQSAQHDYDFLKSFFKDQHHRVSLYWKFL